MRGLLQKDLCLLLQRTQAMVIMIAVGILMGFSTDGSFVIGYLAILSVMMTVSTISYDEYDNGYPFLMSLPITKAIYVQEKYVFCMAGSLVGWVISIVIFMFCMLFQGDAITTADLTETLAFIPVLGMITALILPFQLKYGAEKGRIAIFAIGGGAWALGYFVLNFLPEGIQMPTFLLEMSDTAAMMMFAVFSFGVLAVSYLASVRIMEKKEY